MVQEGITSYKQTLFGILPRTKVLKLEVLGTKKALLFLNQEAKSNRKLTLDFIKEVHKVGFLEILPNDAGKFRTIQVTYSSKEAPHFSKIATMLKLLCDDVEYAITNLPRSTDESFIDRVVELLSHFQHRFVFIHPFIDYNGRSARLFTSYLLMRLSLPIIEIRADKNEERKAYIKALQKADERYYQDLEAIIIKALNESLEKTLKK